MKFNKNKWKVLHQKGIASYSTAEDFLAGEQLFRKDLVSVGGQWAEQEPRVSPGNKEAQQYPGL